MAYPTGMLSLTLEEVDREAIAVKLFAAKKKASLAATNVTSSAILEIYSRMASADARLAAAAAVTGLADYAQAQKGDATLDVVAEFAAMRTVVQAVNSWIAGALPTSGGYLLLQTLASDRPVDRTFTPAQTAGLQTALQAVVDQIQVQ